MKQKYHSSSPVDKPSLFSKFLPHGIAIVVFFLITVIYFSPLIFEGKQIFQEDITRYKGMSKEIIDFRNKTGTDPLWTNSMFGGMPAYQISVNYFTHNLNYVTQLFSLWLPHPVRYVFLSLLGFYFLLIALRVNPWAAIAGALGYGLASYLFIILEVGHNTKAAAMSYMAPALAGTLLIFRGQLLAGGVLTALFLSLHVSCNHPQIAYYLMLLLGIYYIAEFVSAISRKTLSAFLKKTAVLAGAALIALGINITNILTTLEYGKYTIRGGTELTINPDGTPIRDATKGGLDKTYAMAWSYGVGETMTLLIPHFKGGASSAIGNNEAALKNVDAQYRNNVAQMSQYFGDQPFTSGPVYAGAIIVFLFVLGIFLPAHSISPSFKWTLLIGTVLSVWLSWGRHDPFGLSDFMMEYFPVYNKFRAVSMTLVIAGLTLPLMAALALNTILQKNFFFAEKILLPFRIALSGQKIFLSAFALTGGVALLCGMAPGMFTDFSRQEEFDELFYQIQSANPSATDAQISSYLNGIIPHVEKAREVIVKADAWRSFLFILFAAALLWFWLKKQFSVKLCMSILAFLIALDMLSVNRRYLNAESFDDKKKHENPFAVMGRPHQADLQILEDKDPYFRVWNTMARPDQDAATSYFHKSLGGYHGAKLRRYQDVIDFHINRRNMNVINMLNAKYIILAAENNQPFAYRNDAALGNAWFVNEYRIVANPDSAIIAMKNFNPETTAIIEKRFETEVAGFSPAKNSEATIQLTSYAPNQLTYRSENSQEGLAVFSEIYYDKGWNVYLDDMPATHFRANYILRAMRIPAGTHTIEFRFEPKTAAVGEKISMTSMLLLCLLLAGTGWQEWKKKKNF